MHLTFLSRGKQIDESLDGVFSLVVSRFDFVACFRSFLRAVVEEAVGQRAADVLVEENEQDRHRMPLGVSR